VIQASLLDAPHWHEPADTLRWWHTVVRTVHDTLHVLRPPPDAFSGLSQGEVVQASIALVGVLVPILVLWWEVWGRHWLRERKPTARLLYQEVLSNYYTLMAQEYQIHESSAQPGDLSPVQALPNIHLRHRVFDIFQERIGILPGDLPERVVRLYSLLEVIPRLQELVRSPNPSPYDGVELSHAIDQGQRQSSPILVRLHKLNNIQEDLRVVLRGPYYSSTASANEEDALQEEWALRSIPRWLQGPVRRGRRWRTRRRLWRELRDTTNIP
jgi:hypothetical protein